MRNLLLRLIAAALIVTPSLALAQSASDHRLKGRIIRALAVEPGSERHVLVGQKGNKPGSGLVFKSTDGADTWRTQNGNAPLSPESTDVQAVAAISADLVLAGTWKHGLFVSRDGGRQFLPVDGFPSSDIRDLRAHNGKIYVATARHGVFVSNDQAVSWSPLGLDPTFIWSITAKDDDFYASSPESGVFRLRGDSWDQIFGQDRAYAYSAASHRRAVAGENGLYIAEHGPWRKALEGEKFADVLMPDNDTILAASWSNGIAVVAPGGRVRERLLKGRAVAHLQIAGDRLLAGTWGDGLHIIPLSDVVRDRPALVDAVLRNDVAALVRQLDDGADPDQFDANRNTALIFAARDGQLEIARTLIKAGASPGWVDGEQVTPLILAALRDHPDIVRLLLSHGVDRDHRDKWGRTARDYAARRGQTDEIYRLLSE